MPTVLIQVIAPPWFRAAAAFYRDVVPLVPRKSVPKKSAAGWVCIRPQAVLGCFRGVVVPLEALCVEPFIEKPEFDDNNVKELG
jgi:hypothetical protein